VDLLDSNMSIAVWVGVIALPAALPSPEPAP
jgi:hypothetical protein